MWTRLARLWTRSERAHTDIPGSAIAKEEKQHIKTRALEAGILEPERPLALQNALMVAKILRYEFPHDWYGTRSRMLAVHGLIDTGPMPFRLSFLFSD